MMMRFFKRTPVPPVPSPAKPAPEKTARLQRPDVLNQLSEPDLAALYNVATMQHFQPGDSILQEGALCRNLYIIMQGSVRLTDRYGIYNVTVHKGDFFGKIILQDTSRNLYSAVAVTQATVMEINDHIVSHLSETIQLLLYKKLNHLSVQSIEKLASHGRLLHTHNGQLADYIRRRRLHTEVFITSEAFQNIIKNIPRLPKCAGSLSAKLMEESISTKEVTDAVQEEPALAAAILKTINSAYYGLQEKVSSLHHAILYLGFNAVYQLILENSLKNILPQDDEYEHIRLHSYMISLLASDIASCSQKSKPWLNATVGILHDVGKIVTLLLRRKSPNINDIISMVDESSIGACLLRSWEFP
ncbi:MAG: HDOD domain-containing protein, partial [Candidatus Tectimicrobiota bacterium]